MIRFILFLCLAGSLWAEDIDVGPIKAWIKTQRKISSATASFVQERYLVRVNRPIRQNGKFFFKKPGKIRWELGTPPKNIVVSDGEDFLTILQPQKKKATQYSIDDIEKGKCEATADFLSAGIPQEWDDLERVFTPKHVELDAEGRVQLVDFTLKDSKAARFVLSIRFEIHAPSGWLQRVTIQMRDGSRYVTTFSDQKAGVDLPDSLFQVELDGYKVEQNH